MYLELNGNTVTLDEANGYLVRSFDIGYPKARAVVDDRPNADGTDDRTAYFGAKVVTLDVTMTGDKWAKMDALAPFLVPSARPFLYYDDAGDLRRMRLRPMDRQLAVIAPTNVQQVMLQWVAPDGLAEGGTQSSGTALASPAIEAGFTFDLSFDLVFPNSTVVGTTTIVNTGTARSYPTLRLYGPCTDPRIENVSDPSANGSPKRLSFDITLATGDYLEVDLKEHTVLLNGAANKARYFTLDFDESEWWSLVAGSNSIRYFPVSYSGNSRAVILYRPAYL